MKSAAVLGALCLLATPIAAGGGSGVQPTATPQRLDAGQPVVRELADGDIHTYQLALADDEYLVLAIEQQGIDLSATLTGPDGAPLATLNAAKGISGSERLTFIARAAGPYRLTIRSAERRARAGRYEVRIDERRTPTAAERTLEEARVLLERARTRRQDGKYDEALPLARQALAIRDAALPADAVAIADALHLLAMIVDDTHAYAEAEAPNRRALAIREAALGPDQLYKRALAIQNRTLGEDHSEVATTLNDMAVLYNQRGDTEQAIAINRRVLAIRERVLGPNDAGVAKVLNNLARAYERSGDLQQAIPVAQRSVEVWETALGPDHPDLAFGLDTLAGLHAALGDFPAAEPLYRRALAIREKALGADDPEVGTTLNNLAVLYRQRGDYASAEPLFLRDLAITEKALGPNHAFVAPTLINLGSVTRFRA